MILVTLEISYPIAFINSPGFVTTSLTSSCLMSLARRDMWNQKPPSHPRSTTTCLYDLPGPLVAFPDLDDRPLERRPPRHAERMKQDDAAAKVRARAGERRARQALGQHADAGLVFAPPVAHVVLQVLEGDPLLCACACVVCAVPDGS